MKDKKDLDRKRSLRSKNGESHSSDNRFDFDKAEYEMNPRMKMELVSRIRPKCVPKLSKVDETQSFSKDIVNTKTTIAEMTLKVEEHHIMNFVPDVSANDDDDDEFQYLISEDPLSDNLYKNYHKKMLKQESRMVERDINEGENEADKLLHLCDKLNMIDWTSSLPKITVINDINDENEMNMKREATISYIQSMLDKYKEMKLRSSLISKNYRRSNKIDLIREWPKIYKKIEKNLIIDYDSSSDEEEDSMNIEQIRKHRLQTREIKYGGTIKIGLASGDNDKLHTKTKYRRYAIIAEPLRNPYVIKLSAREKKEWNESPSKVDEKIIYYQEFPSQIAVKKQLLVVEANNSTSSVHVVSDTLPEIPITETPNIKHAQADDKEKKINILTVKRRKRNV